MKGWSWDGQLTGSSKYTPKQIEIKFGKQFRGVGTPIDALDEVHSLHFEFKQSINERRQLGCGLNPHSDKTVLRLYPLLRVHLDSDTLAYKCHVSEHELSNKD